MFLFITQLVKNISKYLGLNVMGGLLVDEMFRGGKEVVYSSFLTQAYDGLVLRCQPIKAPLMPPIVNYGGWWGAS